MTVVRSLSPLSTLALAGLSSLLLACGGGSGGSSSNKTPAASNTSSAAATSSGAATSSSASSSVAANPVFASITGLYDATYVNNVPQLRDENYLYIDTQGKITAYNYLGDAVDVGDNCYRVATANDFNYKINGKTLTYSAAAQTFTVDVDGENLVLETANNAISRVRYSFISGTSITMSSANLKLRVTGDRVAAPSVEDIQKSLCK